MKDIHVVGKKMTRNGGKIAKYKGCDIQIWTDNSRFLVVKQAEADSFLCKVEGSLLLFLIVSSLDLHSFNCFNGFFL